MSQAAAALHLETVDNLAVLTLDQPGSRANTLGQAVLGELESALATLTARTDLSGLILRSGKPGRPLVVEAPAGDPTKAALRMDDGHTGEEVLIAAQGPGSERVHGFMADTDIFGIMMAAYGWER